MGVKKVLRIQTTIKLKFLRRRKTKAERRDEERRDKDIDMGTLVGGFFLLFFLT